MSGVSAARREAFRILLSVERGHAHADDLLRDDSVSRLSVPDRHLTTALVLGVLRWQMVLDQQLRSLLARPNAKLDAEVLIALRMGAFQLLHLDRIPARAAIDESVQLAKQAGHRFASGMVNAVLRKLPATSRLASSEEIATHAHPQWMVERWTRLFGRDVACAICKHDQNPPALTIRIATPEVESELGEAGIALERGELLSSARRVMSGDVTATAAFREGRARIQDEGSQLIAEIAGAGNAMPGLMPASILDCCAAPGGKTLILAERNPTARIVACEASASRLESLRERVAPFGDRIECRLVDATALDFEAAFDVVLADVPCSGTGTLSRNPEIRHRLSPEDLPRQAERQQAILASALRAARPGGHVVYSTCSLESEENEQVIAAVLGELEGYHVSSMAARIDSTEAGGVLASSGAERLRSCITPEGYLRILPGMFGTDGFFIALIEKSL
jgi:16S rRNA (cytosine967-C5)-methyltransferase